MFVACSTQCFARYPLERALRLIAELEFGKLDVAIDERGPHLRPSEVAADISLAAQRLRIGPSLATGAFQVNIQTNSQEQFRHQLQAVCRLARMSNVPLIAIPAGPSGSGLDMETERLRPLAAMVEAEGVILSVLTEIGTVTEMPAAALELCQRLPNLFLTLDPSCYINGPNQGASCDQLYPFVRHVQLRDTGRGQGQFQVRVGQGEVEYGRIINQLQRSRYDRLLTVAILDIPEAPYAMETEVRKLKFLLESLV